MKVDFFTNIFSHYRLPIWRLLINSKNIIAFGKTGNYGLKNDFGVNKSSELSTKNLLKVMQDRQTI